MNRLKCFHVTTAQGYVYGVAAFGKRDAFLTLCEERLGGTTDTPVKAEYVGTWIVDARTCLCYSGPTS